jgi:hypothetical protein
LFAFYLPFALTRAIRPLGLVLLVGDGSACSQKGYEASVKGDRRIWWRVLRDPYGFLVLKHVFEGL